MEQYCFHRTTFDNPMTSELRSSVFVAGAAAAAGAAAGAAAVDGVVSLVGLFVDRFRLLYS